MTRKQKTTQKTVVRCDDWEKCVMPITCGWFLRPPLPLDPKEQEKKRKELDETMRYRWECCREYFMDYERRKTHPGMRPAAWWIIDQNMADYRPTGQDQALWLLEHNMLEQWEVDAIVDTIKLYPTFRIKIRALNVPIPDKWQGILDAHAKYDADFQKKYSI